MSARQRTMDLASDPEPLCCPDCGAAWLIRADRERSEHDPTKPIVWLCRTVGCEHEWHYSTEDELPVSVFLEKLRDVKRGDHLRGLKKQRGQE